MSVAALYVLERSSPYRLIPEVDLWPASRDARTYAGRAPIVAHPDCGAWSPSWAHACRKGPDVKALAPLAVEQVRTWGGVLEHPARSTLWDVEDLALPRPLPPELLRPWYADPPQGTIVPAETPRDAFGGFTVEVEACWWTTRDDPVYWRKPTWLYFVGIDPAEVTAALPEPCAPTAFPRDVGYRTDEPNRRRSAIDVVSSEARRRTPLGMARWLVDLAAKAKRPEGSR